MSRESLVSMRCWCICFLLAVSLVLVGSTAAWSADKKVVLMWVGKSGMPKRVASGFFVKIKELAPNMQLIQHRELADMATAEKVFKEAEASSDGIIFLRSSGAEFLAKLSTSPKVPCFVGGCNNPAELGTITNLAAPEGMITGVTYFIPYEKRFEVIKSLFPHTKSVGLLLQKGHPATPIDQAGTKAQCQRLGIAYHEIVADDVKQLAEGAQHILAQVDLFIISSTGMVMDNLVTVLGIANKGKKPIFSYASDRAENGATAELAADDGKLGKMLAESVVAVVVNGTPISKVPVKMDLEPETIINGAMVNSLNLSIPEAILKKAKVIK